MFEIDKPTFMSYLKAIFILALTTSALVNSATIATSANDPFYTALDKTQQKRFTEAASELDALAVRYQRKGDYTNAYRSQATAEVIRYERDYNANKEAGISSRSRKDWVVSGSCLYGVSPVTKKEDSCAFGLGYYKPPTKFKNMGGVVVLDSSIGRTPIQKNPVNGLLDVLVVPKIEPNEELRIIACNIASGSRKGQRTVALASLNKDGYEVLSIRQAWYPDIESKRFQSVNPKLVKCQPI
jgi:hypothetical protein